MAEPVVPSPESELIALAGTYALAKASDEQQMVFGWANVAIRKDGEEVVDSHLDSIPVEELEKAAYQFVMESGVSGEDHAGEVDAVLVESIMFTEDKLAAMGIEKGAVPLGWWTGFHIPDAAAYLRAKTSKTMFSIEGTGLREEIAE
jgi:hypothetical protein